MMSSSAEQLNEMIAAQAQARATRQAQAQAELNQAVERIAREYGFTIGAQARLMDFTEQDIAGNTLKGVKVVAVLAMLPVEGWHPPEG